MAVLGDTQNAQQLLGLRSAKTLDIDFTYELLDGTSRSSRETLTLSDPTLLLDEGLSVDSDELAQCVGEHALEAAAGPDGWLDAIDKFALLLADRPATGAPVIAVEKTLLFDFENRLQDLSLGSTQLTILKDGEYVLFTIAATNFEGRVYHFEFDFDDERVSEFEVELQWPESLQFKEEDISLFRPNAGGSK